MWLTFENVFSIVYNEKGETSMDKKLKELILYIAEKCKDDASFGATKLNKILFISDFNCFGLSGHSITDSKYMHKPNGPVAKRTLPAIHALIEEGRAKEVEDTYFGHVRRRVVPLTGSNTSMFSEDELSLVEDAIEKTRYLTATELSQWTHTLIPWLITTEGEEIPYSSVFVINDLPVESEGIRWARKRLAELERAA
jgi:hypothetical protein